MKLLFAGDCGELPALLSEALGPQGVVFEAEPDLKRVLALVRSGDYDLILLDSSREGFSTLQEIRAHSRFPTLLLTRQGVPSDLVRGFGLGADECVAWPVQPEEMLARISAILLRSATRKPSPQPIRIGDLLLCPSTRRAYLDEQELKLTPIECDILEALMRECGRAVTRDQIAFRLYHREASPYDRSVDTHISRIRRKLGRNWSIISIRGSGYQLCDPRVPSDTLLNENKASIP